MPTSTPTPRHVPTSQRAMRAAIRAEFRAAESAMTPAEFESARVWYRTHNATISGWAAEHAIPFERAAIAAANVSPGLAPEHEPRVLSWILGTMAADSSRTPDKDSLAARKPAKQNTPRGYAPLVRGAQALAGDRDMPADNVKTGNYGRAIVNPEHPTAVAIDVHAYRTTMAEPIKSALKLPSFRAGEYEEIARAWRAVAAEFGLLPSELQAICWVYRREIAPLLARAAA